MRPWQRTRFNILSFSALLLGASCTDGAGQAPASMAGVYAFVPDNSGFSGIASGGFSLSSSGTATRSVHYANGTPSDYVISGTFRLPKPDSIEFALNEYLGNGDLYVWHVFGTRQGDRFTLVYPGAADGTVRDTYRRVGF